MQSILLGLAIILVTNILTFIVTLLQARETINDLTNMYESMLERRDHIIDNLKKRINI